MAWTVDQLGRTKDGKYFANVWFGDTSDGVPVKVGPSEFAEDVVEAANAIQAAWLAMAKGRRLTDAK